MVTERIPPGLIPGSGSLIFTEETIPGALMQEHTLGAGHWGVLHVFEGSIRFLDLPGASERTVIAPDLIVIRPGAPHRVAVDGRLRCRIDFFREPEADSSQRTPGDFADEAVRLSFERCEARGNFAEIFYRNFLKSSPEIAAYFSATDLDRQQELLRDSVHLMVSRDVADPEMREMLEQLGRMHSRDGRNILPRLYEVWLDGICLTVGEMDPEWNEEVERKWRVRLRAGMQIIMAAF